MKKDWIRRHFRKQIDICKPFIEIIKYILHPEKHERRKCFGRENPDKIIYIIRNSNDKAGLFSLLNSVLEKVMYAESKGYYPIVDMRNYANSYLSDDRFGIDNSWEYFFYQLKGKHSISLDSAYNSQNVILSNLDAIVKEYHFDSSISLEQDSSRYLSVKEYFQKYIQLLDSVKIDIHKISNNLLQDKIVLGILCRGTDYISLRPYAHPIQPSLEQMFDKVDEFLKKYNCTHIYLSTEDQSIVSEFQKKYGSILLLYPRKYVQSRNTHSQELVTDMINSVVTPKEAGIDYLGQIYTLAQCKYGILSLTSATSFVCFMSNFESCYIWNLGKYGYDD